MTDKIPDEIMREARRLVGSPHRPDQVDEFDRCYRRVARALMARDQRAAEIARCSADTKRAGLRKAIADAILSYDEARHD